MESLKKRWQRVPSSIRRPVVLIVGSLFIIAAALTGWLPGPGGIPGPRTGVSSGSSGSGSSSGGGSENFRGGFSGGGGFAGQSGAAPVGGLGGMGPGLGAAATFDLRLREVEKKLQSLIDEMKALRKEQPTDRPPSNKKDGGPSEN